MCSSSCEAWSTDTLAIGALGVVGAVKVGLAQGSDLGGLAGNVAIASEPWRTLTCEAGVGVSTHSVGSAGVQLGGTLVSVAAASEGIAGEAGLASALNKWVSLINPSSLLIVNIQLIHT